MADVENGNIQDEASQKKPPKIIKRKKVKTPETQDSDTNAVSIAKKKVVVKKKKKIVIVKHDKEKKHVEQEPAQQPVTSAERTPAPASKAPAAAQPAKPKEEGEKKDAAKSEKHGHTKYKKNYAKAKKEQKEKEHETQEATLLARIAAKKRNKEEQRLSSVPKAIDIESAITVSELAKKMNLRASDLITKLIAMGTMARANDIIDSDTANVICDEFGCKVNVISLEEETRIEVEEDEKGDLEARPPVVTIMGHVDHGKTLILDAIRKSNVVDKESGGITQNIGAYQVKTSEGVISFIDTPGHEAFTMMRSRGAHVTDIVILVVAADDGVMPQTIEAINHAKAAKAPLIVAVNKIDKPQANVERIKSQLSEYGLAPEEWGGETLYVMTSALTGEGIDTLLETITLQAEVLELTANPNRLAVGTVLESSLDVGRGAVATVLVQKGTLHVGDHFIAGIQSGKVRAMFNDHGKRIKEAPPSMPVEVLGFESPPDAGEPFHALGNEKEARNLSDKRKEFKQAEAQKGTIRVTLDNLFQHIQDGEIADFKVIIKTDVQGSLDALVGSLEKLSNDRVRFTCIHGASGAINESDLMLAETSGATIIAYRVRPNAKIKSMAENMGIEIRKYDIIYEATEDIEQSMKGLIKKEKVEIETATLDVRDVFKISKIGTIAGCMVTSGKIERTHQVRLLRDDVVVYTGKLASLKRFKEDVKEVASGYECGLNIEHFNDIKVGDTIESFTIIERVPED